MERILIGAATTDENGVATFTNLVPGNYIFVEKSAPNGYSADSMYHSVTVAATPVNQTVENTPVLTGTLNVFKYDASNPNHPPVPGAAYELKLDGKNMMSHAVTDSNGMIAYPSLFTLATPQTYSVVETAAAPGFHLDQEAHSSSVAAGSAQTIEVADVPEGRSGLTVTLSDKNYTEYTLSGAEYNLYYSGPIT